jgi:hypothetical protein
MVAMGRMMSVILRATARAVLVVVDVPMVTRVGMARAVIPAPDRGRADQKHGKYDTEEYPGALHSFSSHVVSLSRGRLAPLSGPANACFASRPLRGRTRTPTPIV